MPTAKISDSETEDYSKKKIFSTYERREETLHNASNDKLIENDNKNQMKSSKKKGSFDLKELRDYLPKKCFEKDLSLSLYYYFFDFAVILMGWHFYPLFSQNLFLLIAWEIMMGFFFWAVFVVGHDCGHTSFSNYYFINNIFGTFAHGFLFVPFSAWKHSHSEHHMYHNNLEKDRSHAWIVTHEEYFYSPKFQNNKNAETKNYTFAEQFKIPFGLNILYGIFHFLSFHYYLIFGSFDFPHYWPYYKKDDLLSFISTVSAFLIPFTFYQLIATSFGDFFFKYIIPLLIFNSWLVIITFLNHHSEETIVYKNEAFNFVDGALETVDHDFGFLINFFCHNLTDCHIIHHMFFTQIPHYRLKEATNMFYKFCEERNIKYKKIKHFPYIGFFLFYMKLVLPYKFLKHTDNDNILSISGKSKKISA